LLPYISGRNILEIGAAEGVLALLMALELDCSVTALELRPERHEEALRLQKVWGLSRRGVSRCQMALGDIRDRLDLLNGMDTLVAVRAIYYLGDQLDAVFAYARSAGVTRVVLCGNKGRADRWSTLGDLTTDNLGPFNRYASATGMIEVLERANFKIAKVIKEGDPIVIGTAA
jgi:hypothetical protein